VNSIQIMIWAVKACDGTFDDKVERLVTRVNRKIKAALRPPGPSLVGDHSSLRNPCISAGDLEMMTLQHSGEDAQRVTSNGGGIGLSSEEALSAHTSLSRHASSTAASPKAVSVLPEFKTLLLPLEPHFIEVQKFVSAVLAFLSAAMDRISDWKPTLAAFYSPAKDQPLLDGLCQALTRLVQRCTDGRGSSGTKKRRERRASLEAVQRAPGVLAKLAAVTQSRHAAQLGQITAEFPHQVYERLTYGRNDVFDTDQVDQLYVNYQNLIENLQKRLTSDVPDADQSTDKESESSGQDPADAPQHRIPSNREIVIVNTFLASTQQLISALHGLTTMVCRLQAHRDIHVTQDGKSI
jgi:hypothetical protein